MYGIGIDIGGMSIKIGIVSESGVIERSTSIRTNPADGWRKMTSDMCEAVKILLGQAGLSVENIRGIGIGIPGIADTKNGTVGVAINLGWRNVPLAEEFSKYFDLPVALSNDANCAALGEQRYGGGKGVDSMVLITIGTGIGSGIVVDGKLLDTNGGAGAESGHIVICFGGEPCNCGGRGCLESYASATALIKQTRRAMEAHPESLLHRFAAEEGKVSGRTAFNAAKVGDATAKAVVEKYIDYLAAGLISLGNVLHPQAFVLGGGISHEGDGLVVPLRRKLDAYIERSGLYPKFEVRTAVLGNDAGIIGAAALV